MVKEHSRKKKEQMQSPSEGSWLAYLSKRNGISTVGEEWERERDKGEPNGIGPCIVNDPLETKC